MKHPSTCIILILLALSNLLLAQNIKTLKISKINGSYRKTVALPADLRVSKLDEQVVILNLDSISNGYYYGNSGKDSVLITGIKTINLRGPKEIMKYAGVVACAVITIGATVFAIYSFNNPVVTDVSNEMYKYVGLGYMAAFGALGTTLYCYPRTKFNINKYKFQTD